MDITCIVSTEVRCAVKSSQPALIIIVACAQQVGVETIHDGERRQETDESGLEREHLVM